MSVVNEKVISRLQQIFGDRMKVDLIERKLYSYDVGALPSLIKPFVPAGIAGAVVRPMEEAEIVQLVGLAKQEKLQLVPRGASTSGYGGVLPAKGAVVVDLNGMDKVIAVDSAQKIVRVQSGIIWEELQKQINKKGLDLRLYPTSLPASTVGGWLAQGGSGFGSYEYGEFKENVLAARVVMPSGELRNFSGQELADYIADAEGITGIITEVTLSVRDLMPEVHQAFAFKDSKSLGDALKAISQKKLPIWSITFLNPESLRLKKKLPHKHGHPYEEANPHIVPVLPEAYVMIIAYPEPHRSAIDTALAGIIKANKGEELSSEAAEHEWDLRFAPMRLKRIGPSIITTEVIVPTENLTDVLNDIAKKIKQPFIAEGMVGKGDKVTILGFIPHDERSFSFNPAYALALSVINIAKKYNGTAYSTGLYFKREAKNIFGVDRFQKLTSYKAKVDPDNLFNPNKVIGSGLINIIMGLASVFEPLIRPIANAATAPTGDLSERTKEKNRSQAHDNIN